ncbi:hypothetical protein EBR96_11290, partial [bacterium]|nr:hypothetical protein [bacterium]
MKFLYYIFLIINIIGCNAFDKMFLSVCKAVLSTIKTDITNKCPLHNIHTLHIPHLPNDNKNKNVTLVIFKGKYIHAKNYIGISEAIQNIGSKKGININVLIPHNAYIQHNDTALSPLFALGHSSGTYDFMLHHNVTKYNGLIQIGSVLNSNGRLP